MPGAHLSTSPAPALVNQHHEPPTLLVTTLRKERDSLNLALQSELAHRRSLEQELEQLRRRLHEQDQEIVAVR